MLHNFERKLRPEATIRLQFNCDQDSSTSDLCTAAIITFFYNFDVILNSSSHVIPVILQTNPLLSARKIVKYAALYNTRRTHTCLHMTSVRMMDANETGYMFSDTSFNVQNELFNGSWRCSMTRCFEFVLCSIKLYCLQTNMEIWASTGINRYCSEAFAKSWEADIWLYCWERDTCAWVQPHSSTSASQNWCPTPAHCQRWLWQCIWVSCLFVPPNHRMAFLIEFDETPACSEM